MSKEIDFKKLIEMRTPLSKADEYMHDLSKTMGFFPRDHNESWYFNFIDRPNKVYFVSRVSIHIDVMKARILCLLIVDGEKNTYFNEIPFKTMPENLEFDKKIKYYCVKPMEQWRLNFKDRKFNLDLKVEGRFPVVNFGDYEDVNEMLDKYGEELMKVAAQEHYEQPTMVSGTLEFKKNLEVIETRNIKALGHRDHSWGIRKWIGIDGWNWVSAQFEDMTINFAKTNVLGKTPQTGFIHSKDKERRVIVDIEVSTRTKDDGKTPVGSTFVLTDKEGNKTTLESVTIFSVYLPMPSRKGLTEIFEQVAIFTCNDKKGDGISEYLISTREG